MMNPKLAFVGAGSMARSIVGGLLANNYDPGLIRVSDPVDSQRDEFSNAFSIRTLKNNLDCIHDADIVVMAVKPQIMRTLLGSLKDHVQPSSQLMISIAAGITIQDMVRWVDCEIPLIRAMPNTPALVGCGASVLCANQYAQPFHKKMAETIMQAVGEVAWLDNERDMDAVTGISGSGPAYFFYIIEIMIDVAQRHGLDPELSRKLVLQTALGAARLAKDSDLSPKELRQQVTTKRGTTEAALDRFENARLKAVFEDAITAAIERSKSLALELRKK